MSDDDLLVHGDDGVLRIAFNRPARRNATTFAMYDRLAELLAAAHGDPAVRALILESSTDGVFVAGSDIAEFAAFSAPADGVAYERRVTAVLDLLEDLPVPTIAVITGACVGAGLALASACDLRIATPSATFGMPIARTLGNCLSVNTHSILLQHFGPSLFKDMVIRGRMLDAAQARDFGYVNSLCEPGDLDAEVRGSVERIMSHAPLTMWATKQSVRLLRTAALPDDTRVLERVYGSEDFRRGVAAFCGRTRAEWTGH
jgi:enoyl-CoA hydratase/carnithine racemase